MGKRPNLVEFLGKRFGSLVVEGIKGEAGKYLRLVCLCDCGERTTPRLDHVRAGATTSCGCRNKTQGGQSRTREFNIWGMMIRRCYDPRNPNYRFYGGIGKVVCVRWRASFDFFLRDMGRAPSADHTLDRIETTGSYTCGYCGECQANGWPANCRWATKEVQARNAKNNRYYTHDGVTLILKDWARRVGIPYNTLFGRIRAGWDFERAITAPIKPTLKHRLRCGRGD
jgi:hypothetical protein